MKQDLVLEQLIRKILLEQPNETDANLFGGDAKEQVPINTVRNDSQAQEIIDAGLTPNNMNFKTDTTFIDNVVLKNSESFESESSESDSSITDLLIDFFSTWVGTAAVSVGLIYLLHKFKVLKQIPVIGGAAQALFDGIIHTIIGKQPLKAKPNIPTKLKQHFWLLFNREGVDMLAATTYGKFNKAVSELVNSGKINYRQASELRSIIGKTEIKLLIKEIQVKYMSQFVDEIKAGKISLKKWNEFGQSMGISSQPEFIAITNELKYIKQQSAELSTALRSSKNVKVIPAKTVPSSVSKTITLNGFYDNIMASNYFKQKYNPSNLPFKDAMNQTTSYWNTQITSIPDLLQDVKTILKHGNVKFPAYSQFPKFDDWIDDAFTYTDIKSKTTNWGNDAYENSYVRDNINKGSERAKEMYDAYKYIWKFFK